MQHTNVKKTLSFPMIYQRNNPVKNNDFMSHSAGLMEILHVSVVSLSASLFKGQEEAIYIKLDLS